MARRAATSKFLQRLDKSCHMWQVAFMARNRLTPIRLALLQSGRSQRWLAEQLGVSEPVASRIVNGFLPDDAQVVAICGLLGRSESVLFPHLSAASDHTTSESNSSRLENAA